MKSCISISFNYFCYAACALKLCPLHCLLFLNDQACHRVQWQKELQKSYMKCWNQFIFVKSVWTKARVDNCSSTVILGHDHTRRDFKKCSRSKNALGKTTRRACGTDLRAQSIVDFGFTIFKKKKGKSTANTTIYSANCVSMASVFSCTSDWAGVSWSSVWF